MAAKQRSNGNSLTSKFQVNYAIRSTIIDHVLITLFDVDLTFISFIAAFVLAIILAAVIIKFIKSSNLIKVIVFYSLFAAIAFIEIIGLAIINAITAALTHSQFILMDFRSASFTSGTFIAGAVVGILSYTALLFTGVLALKDNKNKDQEKKA